MNRSNLNNIQILMRKSAEMARLGHELSDLVISYTSDVTPSNPLNYNALMTIRKKAIEFKSKSQEAEGR